MFNEHDFLATTTTEASSTSFAVAPPGEYSAIIDTELKVRQFEGKKDPSKTYTSLDLVWLIDDPAVCSVTNRTPTKVRQSIMLDLSETGGLAVGKGVNVNLGRLREAVNLNVPGRPFSFEMLAGRMAKVHVENRVDGDKIYDEVKSVARLA